MEQVIEGGENSRPPSSTGKVVFSIFKYNTHGGVQRNLMRMAEELAARNIQVVVCCMSYDADRVPDNVVFKVIPTGGWSDRAKVKSFEKHLDGELAKEKYIAHVTFSRISHADWYFAADMPLGSVRKPSFWQRIMPRYRAVSAMEKDIFAPDNQVRIMCITNAQKDAYQRIYATEEERVSLLPPGLDEKFSDAWKLRENRQSLRADMGISDDEVLLIQVSSAFRSKGVDRSIAALAALPEDIRNKTRLLIVGRGDPSAYASFAARCGIGGQVIFTGGRDDAAELMAAADLMIHPARNEAAGSVLLESLACGTPVLCSANCGFSPFVRDAGSIVLPRLFRQKILNRALMVALSTPDKLTDLQREAENYGKNGDFYRRAKYAADLILEGNQ